MTNIWQAIRDNCYNLSRNDIGTLRKLQQEPSSSSHSLKTIIGKLSKGELTSFEGIVWVNAFLDLIYVMVIFKIDDILGKCSQQPDRKNDMEAAVNVYIVAIAFFVLMFFTRYQMDFYASSFMQLTSTKTYPLLQSDLFNRSMVVCYGLGMFIMTMNINLEELHGAAETKNNAFLVGACKFVPQYSLGFASGFLITRGLMCIMYLAVMFWSSDPIIRVKYRGTFFFKIVRNLISMVLIAGLFANVSDIKSTNELNISLSTLVAIIEVSGEFLLTSINQMMRHWCRIPETSSFFLEYIRFNTQPEKSLDAKRSDIFPYDSYEKIHESFELFCDANVLQERLSLFFMLILGESFLGVLYLAYDPKNETAFLVQVLVYFLVVSTGTLFFETVDKSVEIAEEEEEEEEEAENRSSRQISVASSRSRLSMDKNSVRIWRDKQKAEKIKQKVHQHGLLAPFPYSYLFVWMHVVVAFTLLLATCGIVGLYSNSSLNLPQRHKNTRNTNTTMPSMMPTSQPTSSVTLAAYSDLESSVQPSTNSIFSRFFSKTSSFHSKTTDAEEKSHLFDSFALPSFSWRSSLQFQFSNPSSHDTDTQDASFFSVVRHSFLRPLVSFGFHSKTEQNVQNVGLSGNGTDDTNAATDDMSYYYYDYSDDSLNFPEYPSLTISEWQMAIGLCLTALGCMVMRVMHRDIGAMAASAAAKFRSVSSARGDVEEQAADASPQGVTTPTTKLSCYQRLVQAGHTFYQYYFLEVMTVGAAVAHILVYVAFHNYQPASDATFLLFAWHTFVNVALSSVHLFQKLTTFEQATPRHRSPASEEGENGVHPSLMVNNPLNASSGNAARLSAQDNALRQRPRYVSHQEGGTEMT